MRKPKRAVVRVVALLALGFKTVPAVIEYIAIERAVQKIKNEGSTVRDIQAAGIERIISIGTDLESSRRAIALASAQASG